MSKHAASKSIDWQAVLAETVAKQDFYRALGKQIELAKRGEAVVPIVPPTEELSFVDGFLVWKGRPVWWSGEGGPAAATSGMDGPGFLNAETITHPVARTAPIRRSGVLGWLPQRWRWA